MPASPVGVLVTHLFSAESKVGAFLKENLSHAHVLIYGILVVIVILFMPDGVLGFVRKGVGRRWRSN